MNYDTSKLMRIPSAENRRMAIIMEGYCDTSSRGKTGHSTLRYMADKVCCVIDSVTAGKSCLETMKIDAPAPIVPNLEAAMPYNPTEVLVGVAPPGGRLPDSFRKIVIESLEKGLTVLSGLHEFLAEDEEIRATADTHGGKIIDLRRVPQDLDCAKNLAHTLSNRRVLTVGSDCALGKKTVSIELNMAMRRRGLDSVFIPTGQSGLVYAGWGLCIDRVIADFASGAVEMMVMDVKDAAWQFIEGQGSLDHAAYGSVTLAIIHGCQPTDMIMLHHLTRKNHSSGFLVAQPINPLDKIIRLHNEVARLYVPDSAVRAIAVNGGGLPEKEIRRRCEQLEEEHGLPCVDVFVHGADRLAETLLEAEAG